MVTSFEHERTGSAINSLLWNADKPREVIDRSLRKAESLRRMLSAPRLFEGLLANAHHRRDYTQLQVSWPLREGQQQLAAKSLTPPALRVPVPAIDALCDGALFCGRSRGLPEAMLVRGALDALGRIRGFGFSVRSLNIGRRSLQANYAAYARVPSADLGLVKAALALAEMSMTATTVEDIEGPVMMLRAPDEDVPAILMTRTDPEAVAGDDGEDVSHGWLTAVDDPKRLAWLLGLPTDEGAAPFAYGEVPDLWRLIATVPDAVDELGFARTWATERASKASLGIDEGQILLVMDLAVVPQGE